MDDDSWFWPFSILLTHLCSTQFIIINEYIVAILTPVSVTLYSLNVRLCFVRTHFWWGVLISNARKINLWNVSIVLETENVNKTNRKRVFPTDGNLSIVFPRQLPCRSIIFFLPYFTNLSIFDVVKLSLSFRRTHPFY